MGYSSSAKLSVFKSRVGLQRGQREGARKRWEAWGYSTYAKLSVCESRVGLHRGLTWGIWATWDIGAIGARRCFSYFPCHGMPLSHLMRSVAGSKQGKESTKTAVGYGEQEEVLELMTCNLPVDSFFSWSGGCFAQIKNRVTQGTSKTWRSCSWDTWI